MSFGFADLNRLLITFNRLLTIFPSACLLGLQITATVKVGMAEAGQVSGALHSVATIIKEDFTDDGAVFEISFMSGEYDR